MQSSLSKMLLFSSLLLMPQFVSCASSSGLSRPREAHVHALLNTYVQRESYAEMFTFLGGAASTELLSSTQRAEYYEEAQELMNVALSSALNNKDYARALHILSDFEVLNIPSSGALHTEVLKDYVLEFFAAHMPTVGFSLLQNLPLYIFSDAELSTFIDQAYTDQRRSDFIYLSKEARKRNMALPYTVLVDPDPEDLRDAVVTLFTTDVQHSQVSQGSGFFVEDGYILTNYHVVEGIVDPKDERTLHLYADILSPIPARVISYDSALDIALVKVEVNAPRLLHFSYQSPNIGQRIFALGTSLSTFSQTLTSGIVSARRNVFQQIGYELQIDAAVHPGSSGGPLLTENGEVIGMLLTGVTGFEGISFAIPSEWILPILPMLFHSQGEIAYAWVGAAGREGDEGIEILYVAPGSPAGKEELKAGDLLQKVNGRPVRTMLELQREIITQGIGSLSLLELTRGHRSIQVLVALTQRPQYPALESIERDAIHNLIYPLLGIGIRTLKVRPNFVDLVVEEVLPRTLGEDLALIPGDMLSLREWQLLPQHHVVVFLFHTKRRIDGYVGKSMQIPVSYRVRHFF